MCLYIQKGTTIGRNTLGSGGQDSNLRSPTYEDGEIDHFSTPGYVIISFCIFLTYIL